MFPSLSQLFAGLLNLASRTQPDIDQTHLVGRSFCLAIDELPQDIGIVFTEDAIKALPENTLPDVTISGNVAAIVAMITDKEDGLESDALYIAGKISTAKHFQRYLSQFTLDWQYLFSKFMNETTATKTAEAVEQALHVAKGGAEQVQAAIKDYILEEKKWLVKQDELEAFSQGIAQLQRQIHQLSSRIDQLSL